MNDEDAVAVPRSAPIVLRLTRSEAEALLRFARIGAVKFAQANGAEVRSVWVSGQRAVQTLRGLIGGEIDEGLDP